MKYIVLCFCLLSIFSTNSNASDYHKNKEHNNELVMIKRSDYVQLVIGNIVNGVSSYDTSAWVSQNKIHVRIYNNTMNLKPQYFSHKVTPEQIKERFQDHLSLVLSNHGWEKHYTLDIRVTKKN